MVAGDLLDMTNYPVIDLARGGSIQGVVDALNWILDVTVVEHMMEGGTIVVPGHGRMTDAADVAYYRDMVTIMRDRVRELTQARHDARADQGGAARRGTTTAGSARIPQWTPDMFVEAIYRSLNSQDVVEASECARVLCRNALLALTGARLRTRSGQQPPAGRGRGQGAPGEAVRGWPAPAVTGRAQAPFDLSGYWVALVTDDWRYRMLTPPKGNADYLPVNAEAQARDGRRGIRRRTRPRRGVPRLRRRRRHAAAGSPAHHVGERQHAEDGSRRGHADAPVRVRRGASRAGEPSWQGSVHGALDVSARRAWPRS